MYKQHTLPTPRRPVDEEILTVKMVCDLMHVHENTVYRWIEVLGLPASQMGRVYRIKRTDLDEWLASRKEGK